MVTEDVKRFAQNQARVRAEVEEYLRTAVEKMASERWMEAIAWELYAIAQMKLNGW